MKYQLLKKMQIVLNIQKDLDGLTSEESSFRKEINDAFTKYETSLEYLKQISIYADEMRIHMQVDSSELDFCEKTQGALKIVVQNLSSLEEILYHMQCLDVKIKSFVFYKIIHNA